MRVRSLIAVSGLAVSGLAVVAPAAVAVEPEIITRTAAEARADCASVLGSTYHLTSCYRSAPGNQYRAGVDCTNSGWRYGPWRNQTADLRTQSRIACPAGGTAQAWRIQFRTN
jgi:hypothetical protein